jgi:RimJ/RimL family protein N-acetyltransferase
MVDPKWIVESERLAFRQFTLEDLPQLIEQRSDPDVNRYLGGPRLQNPESLTKRMGFYMGCYESHGVGMCPMIWKETGEVIGTAGLQPLDGTDEIEVGYSIIKDFWGRGIGTEAALAWMRFGFDQLKLDRIVAVAESENRASRHIMDKIGMKYEKNELHYGADCAFYGISKEDFLAHNG